MDWNKKEDISKRTELTGIYDVLWSEPPLTSLGRPGENFRNLNKGRNRKVRTSHLTGCTLSMSKWTPPGSPREASLTPRSPTCKARLRERTRIGDDDGDRVEKGNYLTQTAHLTD